LSGDYRTVAFRRYLRDYAVAMCWYKKNEMAKYQQKLMEFYAGIQKINAVLNSHKNQSMQMIARRSRRGSYGVKQGRTDYPID